MGKNAREFPGDDAIAEQRSHENDDKHTAASEKDIVRIYTTGSHPAVP